MENRRYSKERLDIFWKGFLKETGRSGIIEYLDVFHFELTEKWANELLRLVLIGQKKLQQVVCGGMKLKVSVYPKLVI